MAKFRSKTVVRLRAKNSKLRNTSLPFYRQQGATKGFLGKRNRIRYDRTIILDMTTYWIHLGRY